MTKSRVRELYEQYVGAMEDWQIKLAIARLRHFRVPPEAWDDMAQELAIVVFEFRFDPAKAHAASEKTILCRAMDNRIRMLARTNARRLACQDRLEQMAQQIEDTRLPEDDVVEEEVRQMVASLSPLQRDICKGLMKGENALQIAKRTGKAWTTINRHIQRIGEAFAERGLDRWFA